MLLFPTGLLFPIKSLFCMGIGGGAILCAFAIGGATEGAAIGTPPEADAWALKVEPRVSPWIPFRTDLTVTALTMAGSRRRFPRVPFRTDPTMIASTFWARLEPSSKEREESFRRSHRRSRRGRSYHRRRWSGERNHGIGSAPSHGPRPVRRTGRRHL